MAWTLDARIPVEFATAPPANAAALLCEAGLAVPSGAVIAVPFDPLPGHAAGCTCCGGRPAAARAFDRLFLARVRGECAWFDRVVAVVPSEAGRAAVEMALTADAATSARFRRT